MTTDIKDSELNTELQELYLIGKHWLSDLDYFDADLKILHKLFAKELSTLIRREGYENIAGIILNIGDIEGRKDNIKTGVLKFMQNLEPLIVNSDEKINLDLIESHALLEREIASLLHAFQSTRNAVHVLIANVNKTVDQLV